MTACWLSGSWSGSRRVPADPAASYAAQRNPVTRHRVRRPWASCAAGNMQLNVHSTVVLVLATARGAGSLLRYAV